MVDRIRQHFDDDDLSDAESVNNAYYIARLVARLAHTASADLGDVSVLARITLRTIRACAIEHGTLFCELADRVEERDQ